MPLKFRLEVDIVIHGGAVPEIIEAARRCLAAEGTVTTIDEDGAERPLRAEEFMDGIETALMELVQHNPLLVNGQAEIERVACRSAPARPEAETFAGPDLGKSEASTFADDAVGDSGAEDDLEDFETGLYLCRWPNGEFSLVKADDREDAVVQLDEWGGAEPAWLVPVETCMVDFRLNDRGEIELAEFGEETAEFIWDECYPELDDVLSCGDVLKRSGGKSTRKAADRIRKAVEHERKRLWYAQRAATPARTGLGRELQRRLGTVGAVADRYVEIAADRILRTSRGEKGKPN